MGGDRGESELRCSHLCGKDGAPLLYVKLCFPRGDGFNFNFEELILLSCLARFEEK